MIYPKGLIVINNIEFDSFNNLSFESDLNQIVQSGSVTINITANQDNLRRVLKEKSNVIILYKEFSNITEYNDATVSELDVIFNGYLADVNVEEGKDGGEVVTIDFKTTMGFVYESSMFRDVLESDFVSTVLDGLSQNVMIPQGIDRSYLINNTININASNSILQKIVFDRFTSLSNFVQKGNVSDNFGQTLDNFKENNSIKIYQKETGELYAITPTYFYNTKASVLQFDTEKNIQNVSFGGLNSMYNAVVVHGLGCVGFAYDPISYELALANLQGTNQSESNPFYYTNNSDGSITKKLNDKFRPELKFLKIKHIFRRNIVNNFDARLAAINELYEMSKTNTITFNTNYSDIIQVGGFFQLKNSSYLQSLERLGEYSQSQIWIIKKVSFSLAKDNINVTVEGYRNGLADFPQELIAPSDGLSLLDLSSVGGIIKEQVVTKLH